jgi:hypothetical protein
MGSRTGKKFFQEIGLEACAFLVQGGLLSLWLAIELYVSSKKGARKGMLKASLRTP